MTGIHSYDVTKPADGIRTKTRKFFKIFALTAFIIILLILVFFVFFYGKKDIELRNSEKCLGRNSGEEEPDIDLRMSEFSKKPLKLTTKTPEPSTKRPELSTEPSEFNDLEKFTCQSTECLHTAARILGTIDFTKEPCEDFYNHACGRIEKSETEESHFDDIFLREIFRGNETLLFLQKFQIFYESCVNHEDRFDFEERVNKTRSLLEKIASFHVNGSGNTEFNLTEFVANMILYNAMPLFDVDIDTDPLNSTFILKLSMPDQTSLKFPHWSPLGELKRKCLRQTEKLSLDKTLNMTVLYNMFLLCQKNYADYLSSISTSINELGVFSNLSERELFTHIRDIRVFIEFEILSKFDEIPLPPNLQEVKLKRQYENIKIAQLENDYPLINWESLFRILTNNTSISSETTIQMYNKEYFKEVFREISAVPRNTKLNNAFLAILASSLFENTVLPVHRHSRVKFCKYQTKEFMSDIVNYLYMKKTDAELVRENNEAVGKLFRIIKNKFESSLENREWLDEKTKRSIIGKVEKIQLVLFQNENIEAEEKFLNEIYRNLNVTQNEYQLNHFQLLEFRRRTLFSLHNQRITPENMFRYFVDATSETPEFFHSNNLVCIPYGLTRKIDKNLPGYMILARVGFPLAKIIGRAFDRIGIQYGVEFTPDCTNSYNYFADQTRDMLVLMNPMNFDEKTLYFNLNNDLSESERISDNTAMRIMLNSFDTFENQPLLPWISQKFSKETIFLIYLTQGFCKKMNMMEFMVESFENSVLPAQLRVKNMLGNSEEFLRIFKCRPGSGMSVTEEFFQFPYLSKIDEESII